MEGPAGLHIHSKYQHAAGMRRGVVARDDDHGDCLTIQAAKIASPHIRIDVPEDGLGEFPAVEFRHRVFSDSRNVSVVLPKSIGAGVFAKYSHSSGPGRSGMS